MSKSDLQKLLSELGKKGAKARAESLTPEQRKKIGQKAIAARWKKYRAAKKAEKKKEK